MVRPVPLVLGVLSLLVGLVATAAGGDPLPSKWLQDLALLVGALIVLGVSAYGLLVRSLSDGGDGTLPARGAGSGGRTPGDEFDARLAEATDGLDGTRTDLRNRVESAAVAVLCDRHGCSPEEARRMLAAGTWTRDPVAASFFDEDRPSPTLLGWLRSLLGDEPDFRERADRATAELLGGEDR